MNEEAPANSTKPPCRREDALAVLQRLRASGHIAYFAGGCVRDELLGITPKDFDVATDAPPNRVRELFSNTQAVGAAFGVILVRHGASVVEVATFRSDGAYLDGRRPSEVKFTTAQEDAKRRDFTINGLFLDPVANTVIDYVGGQEDLKSRILRAIGDPAARFAEDHLRLLRAMRFAARFDLRIDPNTATAIQSLATNLKSISPERIAEELRLMLSPASRNIAWDLLNRFGLTEVVFRFAPPPTAPNYPIFTHLGSDPAPLGLALAGMTLSRQTDVLAGIQSAEAKHVTRALRQALRFSNDEADDLALSLHGLAMVLTDPPPGVATTKRFLARSTATLSRRLIRAIASAGLLHDRIEPLDRTLDELSKTDFAPPPFVTGDDLVAGGLLPGKLFKRVLDETYDAQLEDRLTSKEQAMAFALQLASKK